MTNIKYIDQLSEFHLRDISRLTPGAKVIFGHVPPLSDPSYSDSKAYTDAYRVEVTRVESVSVNDLYPFRNKPGWADEKKPVIFYDSENREGHRYASDSGVLPYNESTNYYNDTNFTVLLEDLEAAGITLALGVSAEYQARLDVFNSKVVVREDDDIYYGD